MSVQAEVPEQPSAQPLNTDPGAAAAVRVTERPLTKFAVQAICPALPQLIPSGLLVTRPPPPPARATESMNCRKPLELFRKRFMELLSAAEMTTSGLPSRFRSLTDTEFAFRPVKYDSV